jgi:hypothetical protein
MIAFSRYAYFTVFRDACFVALAAGLLMLALGVSYEPWLSFQVGAGVSLAFSIFLILRARYLTEERLLRSEAWQSLRADQRPGDELGRALARARLEHLLLRFAKNAAGTAGILYGSALLASML